MKGNFDILFQPVNIGAVEIKNRIVMAPMVTNYCENDGSVTERLMSFLEARAKGGAGLIIVEAAYVHPSGRGMSQQAGIHNDELIGRLKTLVEQIHMHGAKVAVQLFHCGRQGSSSLTGSPLLAPSGVPCPVCQEVPQEMTLDDIYMIVDAFGHAALRAKKAGFDLIEIHGAHGYLINQFLSPYSNKRKDDYGGSFENRTRFPLMILNRVRKAVGNDYPVCYRMSSDEFVTGGLTIEETALFSLILTENGIDAIDVSGGVYESKEMIVQSPDMAHGIFADNASVIRKSIKAAVPVIVAGNIKDPYMAKKILDDGKADMIALGRALLADADFPIKTETGREEEINSCTGCNQGCIDRLFGGHDISCIMNPE